MNRYFCLSKKNATVGMAEPVFGGTINTRQNWDKKLLAKQLCQEYSRKKNPHRWLIYEYWILQSGRTSALTFPQKRSKLGWPCPCDCSPCSPGQPWSPLPSAQSDLRSCPGYPCTALSPPHKNCHPPKTLWEIRQFKISKKCIAIHKLIYTPTRLITSDHSALVVIIQNLVHDLNMVSLESCSIYYDRVWSACFCMGCQPG